VDEATVAIAGLDLQNITSLCFADKGGRGHVALPTFAAARPAAARLLLTAGRAAIDRYFLPAGPKVANLAQWHAAAE